MVSSKRVEGFRDGVDYGGLIWVQIKSDEGADESMVGCFVFPVVGGRRNVGEGIQCCSRWPLVALTREVGKNQPLADLLHSRGIQTRELPCIEHADAEGSVQLPRALEEEWEWIVVTSPEAAKVVLRAWEGNGKAPWKVAAVGNVTADVLRKGGLEVAFTPSKATGKCLCKELPENDGRVLYPSSAKASDDLVVCLRAKGLQVTRLNTYTTVGATWSAFHESMQRQCAGLSPVEISASIFRAERHPTFAHSFCSTGNENVEASQLIDIVAVGSPSALRAWIALNGSVPTTTACIGETSARASREEGVKSIFFAEKPGIQGWAASVEDAVLHLERQRQLSSK